MKPELEKAMAAYEKLGIKVDVNDFDSKLMAQKIAYLLQRLGVALPYRFSLYVRGAYAPQLTKDIYENELGKKEKPRKDALTKKDLQAVEKLRQHVDLQSTQLEVAATYDFLRRHDDLSEDEAIARLKDLKPFIPEREVVVGIARVKQLFPEATSKDIESLREEMEPWERATRKSDNS